MSTAEAGAALIRVGPCGYPSFAVKIKSPLYSRTAASSVDSKLNHDSMRGSDHSTEEGAWCVSVDEATGHPPQTDSRKRS